MILLALLVLVIGVGVGFTRAARNRPLSAFDVRKAVLAGGVIVVVRLGLFWTALALLERPDWRQVAGYALMMFNAIVELSIVSWARNRAGWAPLTSVLIAVTSLVLGWAWAWTRTRNIGTRT